uniref:Uncharacterized protein n=1 Tax=Avena sativa TaxID=4498 RepID=A0ACD5U6U9_AVESA
MEALSILLWVALAALPLLFMLTRGKNNGASEKKKLPLPPGPPLLLFIAKFLVPGRNVGHIGHILRGLHARYGPIISISMVKITFVFVADHGLAHSVLIKGGGNFDDRPPPSVIMELFFPQTIGTSSYGAYWRLVRRNMHSQALHPTRIRQFSEARQRARDAMFASLRADSEGGSAAVTVRPMLTRCLFALIVEMALGVRLGQEALEEMREMMLEIFLALAGFPVFAIFPAITRRVLRKRWTWYLALREKQQRVLVPLIRAQRGADDPPCYADSLLELRVAEEGGRPLTDEEMAALCTEFIIGAVDTSVSLMEWIMAELVNHPDAQAKVYEEVSAKADLSDLKGMPFLKAVVLEGLRLHPGSHIILPHGVKSDAEVGGYRVPKGAVINVLIADLGRDEKVWSEASEFRPERFLEGGDGSDLDITGTRELKMAPFGAGRRMCPGHMLATLHAEYFVGSLVKEFQWLPPEPGQDGVDMTPELASVIVLKNRLRARIVPRTT